MGYVWIVQNLVTNRDYATDDEYQALRMAETMSGCRGSHVKYEDGYFVGPGDGTTTCMVRKFPRDMAAKMWPELVKLTAEGK